MIKLSFLLLLACDIPSTEEIHNEVDNAVQECRDLVNSRIPYLIGNAAVLVVEACHIGGAPGELADALLVRLGCVIHAPGESWDCSASLLCRGAP